MRTTVLEQKWKSTKKVTSQALSSCMGIWPICPTPNRIDLRNTLFDILSEEIIEKIFQFALSGQWQGKEVPLLVALRGTPRLYKIAVKAFSDYNTFNLTKNNQFSLQGLSVSSKKSLKHVKWTLAYSTYPTGNGTLSPIINPPGYVPNGNNDAYQHVDAAANDAAFVFSVGVIWFAQIIPMLPPEGISLRNRMGSCLTLRDIPAAGDRGRNHWIIPSNHFASQFHSPSLLKLCKWAEILQSMPHLQSVHLDFSPEFAYADRHKFDGLVKSIATTCHHTLKRLVVEMDFRTYHFSDPYLGESLQAIHDLNRKILPKLLTVGTCNNVQFLWLATGAGMLFPKKAREERVLLSPPEASTST